MMNWHTLPLSKISESLKSGTSGLDSASAAQRLLEYGKNQIEDKKKRPLLLMFLHQLMDFMILVLVVAAVISGILGDLTDTVVIIAIIFLNALVGFIQEFRAEKAMDALKKMAPDQARVLRDSTAIDIDSSDLVPGDVLQLEAGNIIPADVRFIETHALKVDESALTGESENVEKNSDELPDKDYPLGDRLNMGFKGTFITNGHGTAYVVATGMKTELGHIAKMIQSGEQATPLQKRLAAFGKRLTILIVFIALVVFLMGWLRGESLLNMLMISISLAVAAIPEALPALVTAALALGAKHLAKNKALVRKLPAVETLGSITYICTDKTGTLTINKMTVEEVVEREQNKLPPVFSDHTPLLMSMALNNDASKAKQGKWQGDSTEVALLQYAFENKYDKAALEKKFPRIAELPFDSHRKCMTTLHQTSKGVLVITKGAADFLFDKLDTNQKKILPELKEQLNSLAEKGYRVLGYAIKMINKLPGNLKADDIESSLMFIGFAGMMDPPREEAMKAVAQCKGAGIIPVMITGDHKLTAAAIARQLGIISSDNDLVMTGIELAALTEKKFSKIIENVRVYARVNPEQKLRIIKGLQSRHQFVAMTGDGVNDAPALKNADIGIAMGINGTEVSKEASHMILLDDNFATIIKAIKHGRKIFDNILKFVKYIMTGNSGEIWTILAAPFLGLPIPLLAIHILWINLITDGLSGLALASEPAEANIMKRQPRDPKQNIFSGSMAWHILWVGLLMAAVTLSMQAWATQNGNQHWQTMTFTVLCFSQLGHVMAIRSSKESLFTIGVFSNKPMLIALSATIALQMAVIYLPILNTVFKTKPLTISELGITLAASSIVFWAVELEKVIKKRFKQNL